MQRVVLVVLSVRKEVGLLKIVQFMYKIKGAQSLYFELFCSRTKLPLN